MATFSIKLTGIGAELALGNYMPHDTLIFSDWQEFYHYNDLIHQAQLLMDHISEIEISSADAIIYKAALPSNLVTAQKSYSPVLEQSALYLRTECVEECSCSCEFEAENFDLAKLNFETQDYDLLFKVGKSFLTAVSYDNQGLTMDWKSIKPLGNICLLCKCENGFMVPIYDAVNKVSTK